MAQQKENGKRDSLAKQAGTKETGKLQMLTGLLAVLIVVLGIAMAHEVFFLF